MEEKMKKIIIAILISIIIIILIILAILKVRINNNVRDQVSIGDEGEKIDFNNTDKINVTEKIDYYTVSNCINNYLNSINKNSSTYYIQDEYDSLLQKEYVYNLLSDSYIKTENINKQNILEKINLVSKSENFIPLKMNVLEKENIKKYVAYGIIVDLDNNYIQDLYIIVNLDFKNKTYAIQPINNEYKDISEIEINNENISIEKNSYNTYISQNITNEYITSQYFNLFKRIALSKCEILYNMMPNDYKEKRFANINNFEDYISENRNNLLDTKINQYLVNTYNDYIEYVAKDQYENIYVFKEYSDGTLYITLDTYTINSDKFNTEYNEANDEKKVQMNVDKFVQMINRQDYKTSYSYLDENFKNNYFTTENKFKEYTKDKFFLYNSIEFKNIQKKGNNLYVCNLQLTDITNDNNKKEIIIIMKLNEGTDFKMSLNME